MLNKDETKIILDLLTKNFDPEMPASEDYLDDVDTALRAALDPNDADRFPWVESLYVASKEGHYTKVPSTLSGDLIDAWEYKSIIIFDVAYYNKEKLGTFVLILSHEGQLINDTQYKFMTAESAVVENIMPRNKLPLIAKTPAEAEGEI